MAIVDYYFLHCSFLASSTDDVISAPVCLRVTASNKARRKECIAIQRLLFMCVLIFKSSFKSIKWLKSDRNFSPNTETMIKCELSVTVWWANQSSLFQSISSPMMTSLMLNNICYHITITNMWVISYSNSSLQQSTKPLCWYLAQMGLFLSTVAWKVSVTYGMHTAHYHNCVMGCAWSHNVGHTVRQLRAFAIHPHHISYTPYY